MTRTNVVITGISSSPVLPTLGCWRTSSLYLNGNYHPDHRDPAIKLKYYNMYFLYIYFLLTHRLYGGRFAEPRQIEFYTFYIKYSPLKNSLPSTVHFLLLNPEIWRDLAVRFGIFWFLLTWFICQQICQVFTRLL